MMKMMNCFCGMVDQWKAFSLISSRDHCQRSSPSRISDTPSRVWACAEPEFRLSWMKLCSSDNHYTTAPRIIPLYYLTKNYSTILSDKELLHYIIWQRIIPLYYLTKNYSTILSDKELFTILPEKELFHYIFSERIIPLCYLTTNYSTMLSDT